MQKGYSVLVFLIFASVWTFSQHTFLVGNAQLTPFLDESTILTNYEFQVNSRLSAAVYMPLYFDSLESKESLGLEIGLGTFFNSFYYSLSGNKNASRTTSFIR